MIIASGLLHSYESSVQNICACIFFFVLFCFCVSPPPFFFANLICVPLLLVRKEKNKKKLRCEDFMHFECKCERKAERTEEK